MNNPYDKYGCCISCGYSWCEALGECIRLWETSCSSHRRLTKLQDFTLEELMIFCATILGALGVLLKVIFTSKCKSINCCCLKCDRDVNAVIEEEKLQLGKVDKKSPTKPDIENIISNNNNGKQR